VQPANHPTIMTVALCQKQLDTPDIQFPQDTLLAGTKDYFSKLSTLMKHKKHQGQLYHQLNLTHHVLSTPEIYSRDFFILRLSNITFPLKY